MPISPVSAITRAATRKEGDPLHILTCPTHERYETGLANTNAIFYAYKGENIKDWNTDYAPLPDNYVLLDGEGPAQIPMDIDFDLVLSQQKFGQFQILHQFAWQLHLPLVSLEHTLPMPQWTSQMRESLRNMRGDVNVFISDYSIDAWQWQDRGDTFVIKHMVDSDVFKPDDSVEKKPHVLSIVNDWIGRDVFCNFQGWQRITQGLTTRVRGDTAGLSTQTKSVEELVGEYQQAAVFLNTSTISPIPTVMLEAMSCSCAIITTATCMIPEIIEDGVNGFISNDEKVLRERIEYLLANPDKAKIMGANARQTILDHFSKERFVNEWDDIFNIAKNTVFTGDLYI